MGERVAMVPFADRPSVHFLRPNSLSAALVDSIIIAGVLSSDPPEILLEQAAVLFDGTPEVVRTPGTCSNNHDRYALPVTKVISNAP